MSYRSLSFVMFGSNSLYLRKSCTIFLSKEIVSDRLKKNRKLEKSLQVRKVVVSSSAIVQSFCRTDEVSLELSCRNPGGSYIHGIEKYTILFLFHSCENITYRNAPSQGVIALIIFCSIRLYCSFLMFTKSTSSCGFSRHLLLFSLIFSYEFFQNVFLSYSELLK